MKINKYSPERLWEEILKLDPVEFLGICKIIGVDVYKEDKQPRDFYDIWDDVCEITNQMNRKRRRTLGELIYAATKKEK
jgi:hypothetical protein